MSNVNNEMIQTACEFWELSMLEILYERNILSEKEYIEITEIVKEDYKNNNCV